MAVVKSVDVAVSGDSSVCPYARRFITCRASVSVAGAIKDSRVILR